MSPLLPIVVTLVAIALGSGVTVWAHVLWSDRTARRQAMLTRALGDLRLEPQPGEPHPGQLTYEGTTHDARVRVAIGDLERLRISVTHPEPPGFTLRIQRRPKVTVPLPTSVSLEQLEWYLKIESSNRQFRLELRHHELLREALMVLFRHDDAVIAISEERIEIATLVTTPETMSDLVIAAIDVAQYLRLAIGESAAVSMTLGNP